MDKSKMRQQMSVLTNKQRTLQSSKAKAISPQKPIVRNKVVQLPVPSLRRNEAPVRTEKASAIKTVAKRANVGGCGSCGRKLRNG